MAFVPPDVFISYFDIRNTGGFDLLNHFPDDLGDVFHLDLFGSTSG